MKPPKLNGDRTQFVDDLIAWLETAGATRYDTQVTQYEHAVQSAALAQAQGASAQTIIAALLHDVGHLLADEHDGNDNFLNQDLHHEEIGAKWLARAFGPGVTEPIRLHVAAKRYLCGTTPEYAAGLSPSSVRSLVVQGGPMSADEAQDFIAQPYAAEAVQVRRIDDLAKRAGQSAAGAETYRSLLMLCACG